MQKHANAATGAGTGPGRLERKNSAPELASSSSPPLGSGVQANAQNDMGPPLPTGAVITPAPGGGNRGIVVPKPIALSSLKNLGFLRSRSAPPTPRPVPGDANTNSKRLGAPGGAAAAAGTGAGLGEGNVTPTHGNPAPTANSNLSAMGQGTGPYGSGVYPPAYSSATTSGSSGSASVTGIGAGGGTGGGGGGNVGLLSSVREQESPPAVTAKPDAGKQLGGPNPSLDVPVFPPADDTQAIAQPVPHSSAQLPHSLPAAVHQAQAHAGAGAGVGVGMGGARSSTSSRSASPAPSLEAAIRSSKRRSYVHGGMARVGSSTSTSTSGIGIGGGGMGTGAGAGGLISQAVSGSGPGALGVEGGAGLGGDRGRTKGAAFKSSPLANTGTGVTVNVGGTSDDGEEGGGGGVVIADEIRKERIREKEREQKEKEREKGYDV